MPEDNSHVMLINNEGKIVNYCLYSRLVLWRSLLYSALRMKERGAPVAHLARNIFSNKTVIVMIMQSFARGIFNFRAEYWMMIDPNIPMTSQIYITPREMWINIILILNIRCARSVACTYVHTISLTSVLTYDNLIGNYRYGVV